MTNCVTSISVAEYNRRFSDWAEVSSLSTPEDVATFIDTFEEADIKGYTIAGVITKDGKYIFVVAEQNTGYDFIVQLNKLTPSGVVVTAQNAKLLFGKDRSRGYYIEEPKVEVPLTPFNMGGFSQGLSQPKAEDATYSTSSQIPSATAEDDNSKTEMFEEDDASATGFMDEDDYSEHGIFTVQYFLVQQGTNMRLKISDARGVTIGRSASRVDYVLDSSKVSRKHARIYLNGRECMVSDCGSSNGTFVDGLRVHEGEDVVLPMDGVLLIGDTEFKLSS